MSIGRTAANFSVQAWTSYRALFLWLNWWGYISNVFLYPMLFMAMFTLVGRFAGDSDAASRFAIGWVALAIPSIVLGGITQSFYYERAFGTLWVLFVSPGSRASNYLSRGVWHGFNGVLSGATALAFAALVMDVDLGGADWPMLIALLAALVLSATMFSLFIAIFAIVIQDWFLVVFAASGALISLSGALVPRDALPPVLDKVGLLLPVTRGVDGLRDAIANTGGGATGSLIGELIVALIYAVVGIMSFWLLESTAKRRGAYDTL